MCNISGDIECVRHDFDHFITKPFFKICQKMYAADINQPQSKIKKTLEESEKTIKHFQNPFDTSITISEILEHIKNLKLKKACGQDHISNEMLKLSMSQTQGK